MISVYVSFIDIDIVYVSFIDIDISFIEIFIDSAIMLHLLAFSKCGLITLPQFTVLAIVYAVTYVRSKLFLYKFYGVHPDLIVFPWIVYLSLELFPHF